MFYSVGETILTTEKEIIQNLNIQRQQSKTGKIQKPVKVVLLYYTYIQHKFRGKTSNYTIGQSNLLLGKYFTEILRNWCIHTSVMVQPCKFEQSL